MAHKPAGSTPTLAPPTTGSTSTGGAGGGSEEGRDNGLAPSLSLEGVVATEAGGVEASRSPLAAASAASLMVGIGFRELVLYCN